MFTGSFHFRIRPAIWVMAPLALAAYGALNFAELYIRPVAQVEESRYPLFGKGMTLDRTFVFLQKRIEGVEVQYTARYKEPDVVLRIADRYKQLRHSGCAVTLVVADATNDTPDHEVSFDLHDIQGGIRAVKMTYDGVDFWKIPLQTNGARPLILERSGPSNYTYIALSDRTLGRQVAVAFDHAVGLCSKAARTGTPLENGGEEVKPGGATAP